MVSRDGKDRLHSTLEIIPQPADLGKQVLPPSDKQVVPDPGKQKVVNSGEIEPFVEEKFHAEQTIDDQKSFRQQRKWKKKISLVLLIITLTAVLGGVFGSRRRHSSSSSKPFSNSNETLLFSTTSQRKIAAVSFVIHSVNNTRLYFQNEKGQMMEAANSANNVSWNIENVGFDAKNNSAIAAAVSRPNFPLEISIFYLDDENFIHDSIYNSSTKKWSSGDLSNQKYKSMPNSSLAAMYNQCTLCANTTLLAFQDENGFVQLGNFTSDGWILTQLSSRLDPAMGTGLALSPYYQKGLKDRINLYHQKSNLMMSRASLIVNSDNEFNDGWAYSDFTFNIIPFGSPIAAASSDSKVASGVKTWLELLAISNQGVQVTTWAGVIQDFIRQGANPPIMANSTANPKIFQSVTVTSIGNAFGVVKKNGTPDQIENWQVQGNMVDWKYVGNVDLGTMWG